MKVQTLPREKFLLEVLHDGNVVNTSTTGGNGSASNVTYASTDRGYQAQHGVYGATSTTTFTAVNNTRGCHFRVYPTANNKTVLQLTTTTGLVTINSSNAITVTGATNTTVYVNNVATSTVSLNSWNDVVITWDSYNCSNPAIGNSSFTGNIGAVRFFGSLPSTQEIQSLYMEGLRKLSGASLSPLSDGLIAFYDFNGDANDIIGGSNGTVSGATLTTDRFGNSNRAYSFNGTSDYINLGTSVFNPTGRTFTIATWINTTTTTASIIMSNNWNPANYWILGVSFGASGNFRFDLYDGTNNPFMQGAFGTTLNDGNWHFIVVTVKDGGSIKFYEAGTLRNTISNTTTGSISNSRQKEIGRATTANTYYAGKVGDTLFIDNKELSASEVLALYQLSSTRYLTPLLY